MVLVLPVGTRVNIDGGKYRGHSGVIVRSTDYYYYVRGWDGVERKASHRFVKKAGGDGDRRNRNNTLMEDLRAEMANLTMSVERIVDMLVQLMVDDD